MTDSIHHGPSGGALAAAYQAIYGGVPSDAEEAVNAAYPIIRAELIAEVIKALRDQADDLFSGIIGPDAAADFVARKFGAQR